MDTPRRRERAHIPWQRKRSRDACARSGVSGIAASSSEPAETKGPAERVVSDARSNTAMATTLTAIRGMNDVLPVDAPLWERLEDTAREVFAQYGYANIRVPIVESTPLYVRGIGGATDIVEREMYTFEDKLNGESLTLRPEATAGIVRAAIEHSLIYERPQRVWTAGPMFRHERPQRGRYRQFHQLNVEALGLCRSRRRRRAHGDARAAVEGARHSSEGTRLLINSIGDAEERRAHREDLIAYFETHAAKLDADAKRRLHTNPLRILDSKNPDMQAIVEGAPQLVGRLGDASRAHFDGVQAILADNGVAFEINPRLVRGLDYYNRTVFEWVTNRLGGEIAVAGGGRYDGLFESLGGKPTPATGFAIGMERIVLLLQETGRRDERAPLAYVVHDGEAGRPARLARRGNASRRGLRRRRQRRRRQLQVADEEGRRVEGALRAADRSGRSRLGLGQREAAARVGRTEEPFRSAGLAAALELR
jgi:histidyl-tRNA synthetase